MNPQDPSKEENPSIEDSATQDPSKTNYETFGANQHGTLELTPESTQQSSLPVQRRDETPKRVGRYAITKRLGRGGFGEVYLGLDEQLKRPVAVKLTYGTVIGTASVKMFLAEAQMLADLDHPNIVPVYDIGTTEKGDPFIVSKLVDGTDLASRLEKDRPSRKLSLEIIAAIADALHYAHANGLVHRDVKPANILLDKADRPYLADFGIALREFDRPRIGEVTGTPGYMSPEQARGEGHLITNRSDIYSLGVVLYELLAGRRPFRAKSSKELLQLVRTKEILSPRMFDTTIPRELERVCLKALARRPSDRYSIAKDFANEIRCFMENKVEVESPGKKPPAQGSSAPIPGLSEGITTTFAKAPPRTIVDAQVQRLGVSEDINEIVRVVPKGLRSFDEKDAEFFLELLPGPFDRTGLPECLRFWKNRIEANQLEETFRLGLVYGPSGCGKSSLMKAGLLPRLSSKVLSIYVEATHDETTNKLLKEINRRIPETSGSNLSDALSMIRRRRLVPDGGKLLLVIDQFEQWLYANKNYRDDELTNALGQCDGQCIQAMLMVRDDFWLSVSRFLRDLDVPIVERENSAMVDLFDLDHAKKVLILFGQAYNKVPEEQNAWSHEQKQFVDQAIEGLSQDEKVISVRLALFCEMMKSKAWTPKTLSGLGGISGLGVTFLEETFGDKHSPLQYRKHQQGVRGLLGALLPVAGANIKGHSRELSELRKASGYEDRPQEFSELVYMLYRNLHLITPVDWVDGASEETQEYQLTHDYLVPSLREWLTRKQRETKQGRAELKLAERAATWGVIKEKRLLPTFLEWVQIRWWTEPLKWNESEKSLVKASNRYHLTRGLTGLLALTLFVCTLLWKQSSDYWKKQRDLDLLVHAIKTASFDKLPEKFRAIQRDYSLVEPKIIKAIDEAPDDAAKLKLSLALIPNQSSQIPFVVDQLYKADASQVRLIIDQLGIHKNLLQDQLWETVEGDAKEKWLVSASALADFDPGNSRWDNISTKISETLVKENSINLGFWVELLKPVADKLTPELEKIYIGKIDLNQSQTQIDIATDVLVNYASSDVNTLHRLIRSSSSSQFVKLFEIYEKFGDTVVEKLEEDLSDKFHPHESATEKKIELDKLSFIARQANCAVALMRLGKRKHVYDLLTVDRDPEVLSEFIHRVRGREVGPTALVYGLQELEKIATPVEAKARQQYYLRMYGMLLGLGEYKLEDIPAPERDSLIDKLLGMYAKHPSRAVHSAVGWLLRQWKQNDRVRMIDETPLDYDPSGLREWYVLKVQPPIIFDDPSEIEPNSVTNTIDPFSPIYFTMIVFPGGKFEMGELGAKKIVNVQGPIAVSDREVTWRQYSPSDEDTHREEWEKQFEKELEGTPLSPDGPAFGINWYEAVNYCRWLTNATMPGEENQSYGDNLVNNESLRKTCMIDENSIHDPNWPLIHNRPGFRLLREVEWEYVARGGMSTRFSFGNSDALLEDYAWYKKNSTGWSHVPGKKRPSVAGMFDIHGNLWEWNNDWYEDSAERVFRGGAFQTDAEMCISGHRDAYGPWRRSNGTGFRLAVSLNVRPSLLSVDQ